MAYWRNYGSNEAWESFNNTTPLCIPSPNDTRGHQYRREMESRRQPQPRRPPSMCRNPYEAMIPPQHYDRAGKLVVVLDLDETLVYAREGPVIPRPGLQELLHALKELNCEVLVWTAGERDYAQEVLLQIDSLGVVQHCVYRHEKWWSGHAGYRKDLKHLGRCLKTVLFVDNTVDCLRGHEDNSVLVSDFTSRSSQDTVLYSLIELIRLIVNSGYSVPQALSQTRMLTRRSARADGGSMSVWTLATDTALHAGGNTPRINRDLAAPKKRPQQSTHNDPFALPSSPYVHRVSMSDIIRRR